MAKRLGVALEAIHYKVDMSCASLSHRTPRKYSPAALAQELAPLVAPLELDW